MAIPAAIQRYLDKRAVNGPWQLTPAAKARFRGAVVIPALAESDCLFATLDSLAANASPALGRFLVMVVINHSEQTDDAVRRQNLADLQRLNVFAANSRLNLAWVDAASPGLELPARQAGVGFARKLGLDTALRFLDWSDDPLLVCLDADTLVATNYLTEIDRHFRESRAGAAVLPFCHQPAADPPQQAAIDLYELFLRSYVLGLDLAGSPYAFHSIGSAMACRGSAYVRCGGMNLRQAAEDFHFLQKLAKTDGVVTLRGTKVYPSARLSLRVPFGTGRSMARQLEGDATAVRFYPAEAFRVLRGWLQQVTRDPDGDAEKLLRQASSLSLALGDFLEASDWRTAWSRLQFTHRTAQARLQAFHGWFDGLRTLRLVHHLCDSGLGRGAPEELLPALFDWAGLGERAVPGEALQVLRQRDG